MGKVPKKKIVAVNFICIPFSFWLSWPLKMVLICCPKMMARN